MFPIASDVAKRKIIEINMCIIKQLITNYKYFINFYPSSSSLTINTNLPVTWPSSKIA